MKKKQDITEYCTAGSAAQILTAKLGRPIRPDYVYKMSKSKKHVIRSAQLSGVILYHRQDIANCIITSKRNAPDQERPDAIRVVSTL